MIAMWALMTFVVLIVMTSGFLMMALLALMMKMTLWDMNQNEQRCRIRGGGKDEGEDDADDDLEQEEKEKMGEEKKEEEDNDDDEEEKEDKKTTTTTTTTTITTAIYILKERHDNILHWFNLEWRISRRRRQWIL